MTQALQMAVQNRVMTACSVDDQPKTALRRQAAERVALLAQIPARLSASAFAPSMFTRPRAKSRLVP